MFTKQELQVVGQTLVQRREWLNKNINKPELAATQQHNEKTLQLIDSVLSKLNAQLRQLTHPELPADDSHNQNREIINHYISTKSTSPIRQAALNHRQQLAPENIRVLLVDDDNLIGQLITAYLQPAGITKIDIATDGMQGISLLYDANPVYDLVLCDWNMPIKSGIDVHNALRAAERYFGTVFMLVTAVTEAKQIRSAIEDGVDDYVVKPIEQDKLVKKITRFFPMVKIPENQTQNLPDASQ